MTVPENPDSARKSRKRPLRALQAFKRSDKPTQTLTLPAIMAPTGSQTQFLPVSSYRRTTNNGSTWTQGVAVAPVSGEDWSEPRVTRLGTENRWLMVWRRNQAENLNAFVSTSTDLVTWSAAADSGQQLGRNCSYLWYDNGDVFFYAFSRPYAEAAMSINGNRDSLLVQKKSATLVWSDAGLNWPGWKTLANLKRPLGYLKMLRDSGKTYGIFAWYEQEVGDASSYSSLAIITNDPAFVRPSAMGGWCEWQLDCLSGRAS